MNLIRHNFLQHGLVQPPRNPTNKKQGGPLPVLNRVKWSDKLVTGLATPVSGVVTPLCSCVECRFFQNNSQEVFMRQLLLALANWIGVLDFLTTFWNRGFDGIIARQSYTDLQMFLVFDSEGRTGMLYSSTRWWFQISFFFNPTWGNDPI